MTDSVERLYTELTKLTGINRKRDPRLEKIATDRAMEAYFQVGTTGTTAITHPIDQLKARTWPLMGTYKGVWENAVWLYGYDDPIGQMVTAWWNSAAHHENLVNTDATTWGIAVLEVPVVGQATRYYGITTFTKDLNMKVYLVTGEGYADALGAAPAAANNGKLLLTKSDFLPTETVAELKALNPTEIVLVGGTGAITDNVKAKVVALFPSAKVSRISGANRYDTAAKMSRE